MHTTEKGFYFLKRSVWPAVEFFVLLSAGSSAYGQKQAEQAKTVVDTALARQLNADAYGMKKYVMALLKAGPNRNQDSVTAARLLSQHLGNIQRMAKEGRLVVAGPFLDDPELKGIYIFNVESVEEARTLTESDPAIKAGRLVMELHPWYGSAALQKVNDIHARLRSKSF